MDAVFLLEHVYQAEEGIEERKRIGIYASEGDAQSAVNRLRIQPGFCDYPDNFVIQPYVIDQDNWTEGYDSIDELL